MLSRDAVIIFFRQVRATLLAEMKSRYRGSFAGFFWVIAQPLFIYGAQVVAFHYFIKIDVSNYWLFLMMGAFPWFFIHQSIEMCAGKIVANGRLYKGLAISPPVSIVAQVVDNFTNITILMLLLLVLCIGISDLAFYKVVLVILPLSACLIAALGLSLLAATLQVFYRDTRFVVGFLLTVGFYLTPILYPESLVDPSFRWILEINPFRYLMLPFRDLIGDTFIADFFRHLAIAYTIAGAILLVALLYWKRKRNVVLFYL